MILQAQCTRFHVHWVLLSKFSPNIDYFSVIWYNIIMDFDGYLLFSDGGKMYGSDQNSKQESIRAMQNLSAE
mgnify:CR=1 FL=1